MSSSISSTWVNFITSLYPDALRRTYCVPPVYFHRVPYVTSTVPGTSQSALVLYPPSSAGAPPAPHVPPAGPPPQLSTTHSLWTQETHTTPPTVQESDLRDDFSQQHVLVNLQELGRAGNEAMFVISQMNFSDYLNQPAYAAAIAAARLPRPINLPRRYRRHRHGDFDFLLIHRLYGILIGELKSVGRPQAGMYVTQTQSDASVTKKVRQAVGQLDKGEIMIRHLLKNLAPGLTVRKTLCLPYVSSAQLQRVLTSDLPLQQAVCRSLGAANAAEATQLCLCSDQLSDPATYWDVTPAVLSQLTAWWQRRMACTVDPLLTDTLYLDIVARFVGPASTVAVHCSSPPRVEIRTEGEAIQELGNRLARLVLTLPQLDLMIRNPPLVFLSGPPGTGKTLLMVLQGLRWLHQGHDVYIVSDRRGTLAASHLIKYQLDMTVRNNSAAYPAPSTVHLHQYNFYEAETVVRAAISTLSASPKAHVLLDEAAFHPTLAKFVTDLKTQVPQLQLWAAGVSHAHVPRLLQQETLTTPLRFAPVVQREVQQGLGRAMGVFHNYSNNGVAAPGDGLRVVQLTHAGAGHTGRWPHECPQCGKEVADELNRLGVGQAGNYVTCNDVFVLTRSYELQDEKKNDVGQVTSPASGVVGGLRASGFPVCVLEWRTRDRAGMERDVASTAAAATSKVTVANSDVVRGLERKVVVILSGRNQRDDDNCLSDAQVDDRNRIFAMSRCTTHLITVTVPTEP